MVAGARSASFGLRHEKPEAVRITMKVAATETALYTKRGDCRPRSHLFALRQLCGPSVTVKIESRLLGGLKKPVEVIAQARFGLIASPGHGMLRVRFAFPISFMQAALPSVAGCGPVRCVRD